MALDPYIWHLGAPQPMHQVLIPIKACKTKLEKIYFSKSFGVINFRTRRKNWYFIVAPKLLGINVRQNSVIFYYQQTKLALQELHINLFIVSPGSIFFSCNCDSQPYCSSVSLNNNVDVITEYRSQTESTWSLINVPPGWKLWTSVPLEEENIPPAIRDIHFLKCQPIIENTLLFECICLNVKRMTKYFFVNKVWCVY